MRFGPLNSIRTRLILSHVLVGVLSVLIATAVHQFYAGRMARRLEQAAPWRRPGPPPVPRLPGQQPPETAWQPPRAGQRPPGAEPRDVPGGPAPGVRRGGPAGRGRALTRMLLESLPAGLAFATALCVLVGWWVGRRLTRPLAALAEGARALHATHFSHRVPVTGNDELAEVAASMNEMAERVGEQVTALEEDADRRRQVLADVAHELRSPVATLRAMTGALRDGVAAEPERRAEALTHMDEAAARMERLVTDLLEVSRLDLHEVSLVKAPMDLRELAEDVVHTHASAAEAAGIRLAPVEGGEPVWVEADRLRLSQALDNLVENALAYAGEGAQVRLLVQDAPPGVVVEDNGRGIAARHMPFVFDAFYRADAARTPGTSHSGLGLRIARGLVEAHGGSLTLESEEGRGTRATITLPESAA